MARRRNAIFTKGHIFGEAISGNLFSVEVSPVDKFEMRVLMSQTKISNKHINLSLT